MHRVFKKINHHWCYLVVLFLTAQCSILPPRRQYIKEAKHQKIPAELLNTSWTLEKFDSSAPDCPITMHLLERGKLTIEFKAETYDGDHLWYIVNGPVIEFHTHPMEKLAWTSDGCEMNPFHFAMYLDGDQTIKLENNTLSLSSSHTLIFTKSAL